MTDHRKNEGRGTTGRGALGLVAGLGAAFIMASLLLDPWTSFAQQQPAPDNTPSDEKAAAGALAGIEAFTGTGMADSMLHVPVTNMVPGNTKVPPSPPNPVANDPNAAQLGMTFFTQFNCVGCHAANGGGGMGPSLSNHKFIYGSSPQDIYLSILQGRPHGMPAWGYLLPDQTIWDLVAYIKSLSDAPVTQWGKTTSLAAFDVEQVPAEKIQTANPWAHTEKFSFGMAPADEQAKPVAPASGG